MTAPDPDHPWSSARHEQILRQPKNLYLNIVQSAILTALARGHRQIMFQGGAAALLAQQAEHAPKFHKVTMTAKNYAYYQKKQAAGRAAFAAARVGDATIFGDRERGGG